MDPLPLVNDYARTENVEAQQKIHQLITEVYEALPFPVVHVPILPPVDRANFILSHVDTVV
jgi:predicted ATPase